jgi:hypothetical protein
LFKVEWEGSGFIGLSSKTYYCFGDKGDKLAAKGVNKSAGLSKDDFLNVINTRQSISSSNRGLLTKNNETFTYEMERRGLSFFYCKRRVLNDSVSTTYLDI